MHWKPEDRVLSLACGAAWWEVNLVFQHPAKELFLLDRNPRVLSKEQVDEAIDYFQRQHQKIWRTPYHLLLKEAWDTGLEEHSMDHIIILNAWHEMQALQETLLEIKRIIKPGGKVFLEEEISFEFRRRHEDCQKPLFFLEEILRDFATFGLHLVQHQPKDEKAIYLLFQA